jgi:hypothetical protein
MGLVTWADEAIVENTYRAQRATRFGSLYEGYRLTSLGSSWGADFGRSNVFEGLDIPIIRNRCRRGTLTLMNKLMASDSPLPQFVCKGGDYEQQLKAENLDQVITVEYDQEQGDFADVHELHRHGGTLAIGSVGSYGIFAFPGDGKVVAELDDTLTIGTVKSSRWGQIQTLVRTTTYDPEDLVARYGKAHEEEIRCNVTTVNENVATPGGAVLPKTIARRVVIVIQGWRVQIGEKPGSQLFVLRNGHVLEEKAWKRKRPPCRFWHYERELNGDWGTPFTQTIYNQATRENRILEDVDDAERNTPHALFGTQVGPQGQSAVKAQLLQAKGVHVIDVDGPLVGAIHQYDLQKFDRNSLALAERYGDGQHEDSGVPKSQAFGVKQPGTSSGRHEHLSASYFTENFADPERRLIRFRAVDTAVLFLWAIQDMLESEGSDYVRWVGDGKLKRQLKGEDLDLDEDKYIIEIKPVSEEKDTPKTRLDKAENLLKSGWLTGSDWVRMEETLDYKSTTDSAFALEEWVEEQHRRWLTATESEMSREAFFQSPELWMQLDGLKKCLRSTTVAFLQARQRGVPGDRLSWFEKFNNESVALIQQEEQRMASLGAPPGMPPAVGMPPTG